MTTNPINDDQPKMQNETIEFGTKQPVKKKSTVKKQLISDLIDIDYERQKKIEILAYQKAEKRGFTGSEADSIRDWIEAEREISQ